jgi:hypothetical protein
MSKISYEQSPHDESGPSFPGLGNEKIGGVAALQSIINNLVMQVCDANNISQPRVVDKFCTGTHPAFHLSAWYQGKERDVVVKLLLAERDGERFFDRECAGYELISRSLVKHLTPRLLASGRIESTVSCPGCSYIIVSFAKGVCVNQGFLGFTHEEQVQFATQVGVALRGLHQTEVVVPRSPALSSRRLRTVLDANVADLLQNAPKYLSGGGGWRGLSAEASARAAEFVKDHTRLLDDLRDSALLHGDPHRDHFFVKRNSVGSVELSGIIDFADAVVFDPLYDFTSVHMDLFGGDLDLLRHAMEAYGLNLELEARRKLLLLSLVHEFDIFERVERDRVIRPMGPLRTPLSSVSWDEFRNVIFGLKEDEC